MESRREFLKKSAFTGLALSIPFTPKFALANEQQGLRFGVIADIHHDVIHDGQKRLEAFIEAMTEEKVDFIIQLGDFCYPLAQNRSFLKTWEQFNGPRYHVLGNHEMDKWCKNETMDFLGMKDNIYSFDAGNYHFVVLDSNFLYMGHDYQDYEKGNFYEHQRRRRYIHPYILEWLQDDLNKTDRHSIIFSHHSLENDTGGIRNRSDVRFVLEEVNRVAGFQKVVACFNGHDHVDFSRVINNIHYVQVNSASYQWVGEKYSYKRFSDQVEAIHPDLKNTIPYKDPLFAVVSIDATGKMEVKGRRSEFVAPGPKSLGHSGYKQTYKMSAKISNLDFLLES